MIAHTIVGDLEQQITSISVRTVLIATAILVVATAIAAVFKGGKKHKKLKLPLFLVIAGTMAVSTVILFVNTIYLNVRSESGGPVHWHTDIEFWACGSELELRDPTGFLSNKIGTATYHEHNDKRIHLEGVVVRKSEDASLEKFMRVIGGYVNENGIAVPLNEQDATGYAAYFASDEHDKTDGDVQDPENFYLATGVGSWVSQAAEGPVVELKNGRRCGADEPAQVQAFVLRTNEDGNGYTQIKLKEPAKYIMRDESVVPPGDCLIIEYDKLKSSTDKLCLQYGVRDSKRCTEFGVEEYTPDLCNMTMTNIVEESDMPGGYN